MRRRKDTPCAKKGCWMKRSRVVHTVGAVEVRKCRRGHLFHVDPNNWDRTIAVRKEQ